MKKVKIGKIKAVYDRGDGLDAYVSVEVAIDDKIVTVGTMIGVMGHAKQTVRHSGSTRPFLRAWQADSSDFSNIDYEDTLDVANALSDEAERLWLEFEEENESSFRGGRFE